MPRFLVIYESGLSEVLSARDLDHATERATLLGEKYHDPVVRVQPWRTFTERWQDEQEGAA